ncbi:histidine triad (HIT) protein [Segniliparus rotundus DSM 44985]|uniref:Histidine triad (HIT) protein n=1 Tax=Segniliparus rotundus (strain ATCC BAA-972 / CDC 1076 / CIP 108378 / DSM 44985 / JCM 13578) TaxID=640132 RepID=D6Z8M6_SEGRD|nr:HIT family protein [Segniliparus rotundus]ADG98306.1 histidine triad (HIT) protein [Segniliparus rotundus DSM 44985]
MPANTSAENCVFCAIVAGVSPAYRVYEDDDIVAFLDIRPVSRGHTLVIPKPHSLYLEDLDPGNGAKVFQAAQRIARGIRRSDLGAAGVHLVVNDGRAAMQTVFHTHLHVIPRRKGDKLSLSFLFGALWRKLADPERTAEAIREGLRRLG